MASTAYPEFNPLEDLWRETKNCIRANEPTPDVDCAVIRACEYLESLSPEERLRKASTLSTRFWLPAQSWIRLN